MATLKWLLNASLMIAFIFLGMKAQPEDNDADKPKTQKSVLIQFLG